MRGARLGVCAIIPYLSRDENPDAAFSFTGRVRVRYRSLTRRKAGMTKAGASKTVTTNDSPDLSHAHDPAQGAPHVLILMAVWNGADHLQEQLDSFAAQSHANWTLWASDDGSDDNSREILERFARAHPRTRILEGPGSKGAENFLSLLRAVPEVEQGQSFIAFSDQDDVWMADKLRNGIAGLSSGPGAEDMPPAMYCSTLVITDSDMSNPRPSPPRPKPAGFRNALVQNIASGNTTLLNPAAARLVCEAAHEVPRVVVHDWWVYQLVAGAGGRVVHDDTPSIYYRQHGANQIGANDTLRAQFKRIAMLLSGDYRDWNEINIAALRASRARLTPENRARLEDFAAMRKAGFWGRIKQFHRLALYRQSMIGTLALWLSVVLRRI
ncbi:glycosyltransferase [Rhodobacteraceae bacterium D3-12]|nr:glycosyltransferase [Rhodobacteraceae bacterium D3-12]